MDFRKAEGGTLGSILCTYVSDIGIDTADIWAERVVIFVFSVLTGGWHGKIYD